MAIASVRAKLQGNWYELVYNASSGYYEAVMTPSATSAGEPGGYYSVEVVADNDTGESVSVSGASMEALRLVVKEATPPVLTLVSPAAGLLITNTPSFVIDATDTGSGVDLATLRIFVDGAELSYTSEAVAEGYRATAAVAGALSEGGHVLTAEVYDRDGNSTSMSAAYTVDTLRPILTLVSPEAGIITTNVPVFVIDMTDETSGIVLSSIKVSLDGVEMEHTAAPISKGYRVTCSPAGAVSEGGHVLAAVVYDAGGHSAEMSAAYIVDTVPPELWIGLNYTRRVVDVESVLVYGWARDVTTGMASLVISGGAETVEAELGQGGEFAIMVPLDIGANDLLVDAKDLGGLSTTQGFRVMRLITDRVQEDVDRAADIQARGWEALTDSEKAEYLAGLKGEYKHTDLNRVSTAEELLKALLAEVGCNTIKGVYKNDWVREDDFKRGDGKSNLINVAEIRDTMPINSPLPESMRRMDYEGANEIEAALVGVDMVLPGLRRSFIYSGEGFSGEF